MFVCASVVGICVTVSDKHHAKKKKKGYYHSRENNFRQGKEEAEVEERKTCGH